MAAKTTLNAQNLQALGAERLAELLIEISSGSALAKRRLRLELAGAQSPAQAAREITKRLSTIAAARARVTWRSRKGVLADLETQLQAIAQLAEAEPHGDEQLGALSLAWRFLQIGTPLFQRCVDTSGQVLAVFHRACEVLGQIALGQVTSGRLTPESLADAAFDALQDNLDGQYDPLIPALAPALGPQGLAHLKSRIEALGRSPIPVPPRKDWVAVSFAGTLTHEHILAERARVSVVRLALQDIADVQGDVDGFVAQYDAGQRRHPLVAAQIAARLAPTRPAEALAFLDQAQGRLEPEAQTLRLQLLESLGRGSEAQAHRLAQFQRDLDPLALRAYLKKLADFEDVEALDAAMAHVAAHPVATAALRFSLAWPALDLAARLLVTRRTEIDGDDYDSLTQAAEALSARYPLAATIALRAMVDFTLRSGRSTRYVHGARHLVLCGELAPHVEDWQGLAPHELWLAGLRRDHGRKAGFWAELARNVT